MNSHKVPILCCYIVEKYCCVHLGACYLFRVAQQTIFHKRIQVRGRFRVTGKGGPQQREVKLASVTLFWSMLECDTTVGREILDSLIFRILNLCLDLIFIQYGTCAYSIVQQKNFCLDLVFIRMPIYENKKSIRKNSPTVYIV